MSDVGGRFGSSNLLAHGICLTYVVSRVSIRYDNQHGTLYFGHCPGIESFAFTFRIDPLKKNLIVVSTRRIETRDKDKIRLQNGIENKMGIEYQSFEIPDERERRSSCFGEKANKMIKERRDEEVYGSGAKCFASLSRSKFVTGRATEMAKPYEEREERRDKLGRKDGKSVENGRSARIGDESKRQREFLGFSVRSRSHRVLSLCILRSLARSTANLFDKTADGPLANPLEGKTVPRGLGKVLRFTSSFLHPIDFDFEEIRVLRKEEGPIVDRWSFVETLPNESLMEF
ncbi:hypothetical protein V1477_019088 [Vespula maculifrons]|uniref:Uncharacterized protein n=1 Tax=Vespula maculifrons TaxID=7453 RepID=A0ABD2ARI8_VESMC